MGRAGGGHVGSIRNYEVETNRSVKAFARGLFDAYGIGRKETNDGVLLLVSVRDRKVRIELGAGYGRGRDEDGLRIVQEDIVPHFKQGDYRAGVVAGVEAIMLEFAGVRGRRSWLLLTFAAVVVAVLIAYSLFRSGKTGWGWVCAGLVIILVLLAVKIVFVLLDILLTRRRRRWYSDDDAVGGFWSGLGGGS
ncbi:MAG: TPM domain-containing protein, partial [Planctomycetota bacterium]